MATAKTTTESAPKTVAQRWFDAQLELEPITKNAKNDFFKDARGRPSRFVDLTQLLTTVQPILQKHGLIVQQRVDIMDGNPILVTQLADADGNTTAASHYPIIAKDMTDPQKFGAGVTYARRYALMAYLSLGTEDDDGNTAAKPKPAAAITPELQTLIANLKSAGHTKETIPAALDKRFGKGVYKSITALKPEEITAWNEELVLETTTGVPF